MSISEKILDAIELLATKSVEKAGYDRTIQAQIISCEDATIGKYRCRYQDAIIQAYASNTDTSFSKGAYVYILVPSNDMRKEKTILGTTDKLGINYISQAEGDQAYDIIGINNITSENVFYLDTINKNYLYTLYSYNDLQSEVVLDINSLNQYIKQSSSLIVGATFKTSIPFERQSRGHYGIVFNLKFFDNASGQQVIRTYIVDEDNMVDNPYRLLQKTRQYQIFDIDGTNFIRVESIQIFNKNFPGATGLVTDEKLISGDIEISALELYGAERMTESEINGVSISFYTPQGTFFADNVSASSYKTITAQVKIKGKLVSNDQNLSFYWGSENVGITPSNRYYNKYLGRGWKCLNDSNEIAAATETQDAIIEWVPGSDTYILNLSDATAKDNKIKVAVIYDENVITKEINIQNLGANIPNLSIQSDGGNKFYYDIGHPTLTCLVDGEEEINYHYYWAYESNTGIVQDLPETTEINSQYDAAVAALDGLRAAIAAGTEFANAVANQISNLEATIKSYDFVQRVKGNKIYDVQINNITNFSIFKCSVYNANNVYLGTTSLTLTNTLEGEGLYSLVINNGTVVFQYDENGVAPNSKSLITPQQIQGLSFTIYDNLGNPIDEGIINDTGNCTFRWEFPIKDSMLVDKNEEGTDSGTDETETYRYYDNIPTLIYNIGQKYDIKKQRNQIKLTVNYKNMNLTAETSFTFSKQGEPGTNGTEFVVKLVPNTLMENPPLWPVVTRTGSTYRLNYGHGSYNDETEIGLNIGYQLFKVQLWHSGDLVWEGASTATAALDGYTNPDAIEWSVLANKYNTSASDDSAFEVTNAATGMIAYKGDNLNSSVSIPYANIIKCSITWEGKTYTGTIPITTAWTQNENYRVDLKNYTGFRYVMYSSDGMSPQYDNSHPFEFICKEKINNIWEDISTVQGSHQVSYTFGYNGSTKNLVDGTSINAELLSLVNTSELNANQKNYRPVSKYSGECVNAAVTCIYSQNGSVIGRINVPIHFLLNKYGLSNINAWDGNSVQINEDGGYILSPQMGAGVKDTNNNFTGVLMGEVKSAGKSSSDIGLLGYKDGDRTFFLNSQNGSALLGKAGNGQIALDPSNNKALLYSSNFWKEYNAETGLPKNYTYRNNRYEPTGNGKGEGLLVDLTTPELYFGSGKFYVNNEGILHAQEANISGNITAESLTLGSNVKIPGSAIDGPIEDVEQYVDQTLNGFINGQYATDIGNLQDQIDGNITTWFYDYEPTLNNVPTSDWITINDRVNHLGDLFYDQDTGYCYRFQFISTADQENPQLNDFEWVQISDSDIAEALNVANQAQDTADSKRRVFFNTPQPPYDPGDLWTQGGSGDILRCQTKKEEGQTYSSSDWVKASKYTDDTAVQSLTNTYNEFLVGDAAWKSTYGQKVTSIDGRVSQNESTIDQMSDQIVLKVKSTTDGKSTLAAVKLSADGGTGSKLLLTADTVDIVGATIFQSGGYLNETTLNNTINSAVETVDTGLGIKWNSSTFDGTWNPGEAYFCKYDSSTGQYTDANGWVMFNGVKRTVEKGMQINPNTILPYNVRTYKVLRLSSATATTGTQYYVYYDGGWKSASQATPTADTIADWTWNVNTDIVLCSYVEPSSEGALVEYEQYTPVRTAHQITNGDTAYQKAKAAQTTADAAAPKTNAVAKTQRIYYRSSSSTKPTSYPTAWVTTEDNKWNSNATTASGWTRKVTPIANGTGENVSKYLYLWTATQKQMVDGTVVTLTASDIALDDSTTIIDGGTIVTGTLSANVIKTGTMSAERISGGTLKLGGADNGNGLLTVYNSSNTLVGRINNAGLYAIAGTIGGFTIGDSSISKTKTSYSDTTYDGVWIGTTGIGLGKGKFYVTAAGALTATSATITGTITAESGTIGGWTVNKSYGLYTNSKTTATSTNTGILIQKDGGIYAGAYNSTNAACPFQVTSAGALTAISGKVGGWTLANNQLSSGSSTSTVGLSSNTSATTNIAIWAGHATSTSAPFRVARDGSLVATKATISGDISPNSDIDLLVNGQSPSTTNWRVYDTDAYNCASIWLTQPLVLNQTYTITIWGGLPKRSDSTTQRYAIYLGGGSNSVGYISSFTNGKGTLTFKVTNTTHLTNQFINIYNYGDKGGSIPSGATINITAVKLQEGHESTAFTNATIINGRNILTGSIQADKISVTDLNALNATIGGWNIGNYSIYGGSGTGYVRINSSADPTSSTKDYVMWAGNSSPTSAPFRLTRTGVLTVTGADITGEIHATSGTIGKVNISSASASNMYLYIGSGSTMAGMGASDDAFWAGSSTPSSAPFHVTYAGALTSTSGKIGGWKIDSTTIRSAQPDPVAGTASTQYVAGMQSTTTSATSKLAFYIAEKPWDGSAFGDTTYPFAVAYNGSLFATKATITGSITASKGGNIGGFYIKQKSGTTALSDMYMSNTSNGSYGADGEFIIIPSGTATSKSIAGSNSISGWGLVLGAKFGVTTSGDLYANAGKIGGWTISANYLGTGTIGSANGVFLYPGGYETAKSIGGSAAITGWTITSGANFGVTKTGALYATSGGIGGWKINSTSINKHSSVTSGTAGSQYVVGMQATASPASGTMGFYTAVRDYNGGDVDADASYGSWSYPFKVTYGGKLTATNADITGKITADSGKIGRFTISSTSLYTGDTSATTAGMGGNQAFWAGNNSSNSAPFRVSYEGALVATNATITGTITSTNATLTGGSVKFTQSNGCYTQISNAGFTWYDTSYTWNLNSSGLVASEGSSGRTGISMTGDGSINVYDPANSATTHTSISGTQILLYSGTTNNLKLTNAGAITCKSISINGTAAKTQQSAVSSPSASGTAQIAFIDSISQNANGVISPSKAYIREASESQSGLVSTDDQNFAGVKEFQSLIRVRSSNGTPQIDFVSKDTTGQRGGTIYLNMTQTNSIYRADRFYFREYSYNSTSGANLSYYESYRLPAVTAGKTANSTYEILTSKSKVSVVQGGTGAGNAATARTNLGVPWGETIALAGGSSTTVSWDTTSEGCVLFYRRGGSWGIYLLTTWDTTYTAAAAGTDTPLTVTKTSGTNTTSAKLTNNTGKGVIFLAVLGGTFS